MDQAQRAQRLDQGQLIAVKFAELLVAVHQQPDLAAALAPVAAGQHPQVLHGRAHARVVQVHKVRARPGAGGRVGGRPQDIAGVAVAVQAQQAHAGVSGACRCAAQRRVGSDQGQRLVAVACPAALDVQGHLLVVQQPVARRLAKALQIEAGALHKGFFGAHRVDACQKAAYPFQHFLVVQLGRPPAPARADAKGKALKSVQRAALQHQRPHCGNFGLHQLLGKGVLLQDLGFAPAFGPVKLGHHGAAVLKLDLVNPVFVGRQSRQPPVAAQADGLQGVQNQVGGERFKNMVHTPIVSPERPH